MSRHHCPWCGKETRLADRQAHDGYCSQQCVDITAVCDGRMTQDDFDKKYPPPPSDLFL